MRGFRRGAEIRAERDSGGTTNQERFALRPNPRICRHSRFTRGRGARGSGVGARPDRYTSAQRGTSAAIGRGPALATACMSSAQRCGCAVLLRRRRMRAVPKPTLRRGGRCGHSLPMWRASAAEPGSRSVRRSLHHYCRAGAQVCASVVTPRRAHQLTCTSTILPTYHLLQLV